MERGDRIEINKQKFCTAPAVRSCGAGLTSCSIQRRLAKPAITIVRPTRGTTCSQETNDRPRLRRKRMAFAKKQPVKLHLLQLVTHHTCPLRPNSTHTKHFVYYTNIVERTKQQPYIHIQHVTTNRKKKTGGGEESVLSKTCLVLLFGLGPVPSVNGRVGRGLELLQKRRYLGHRGKDARLLGLSLLRLYPRHLNDRTAAHKARGAAKVKKKQLHG